MDKRGLETSSYAATESVDFPVPLTTPMSTSPRPRSALMLGEKEILLTGLSDNPDPPPI